MPEPLWEQIQAQLGLGIDVSDVGAGQMVLRTIIIYAFTLGLVRLGSARFLAKASAFDVIVAILLGSIMSRAINGSGPLFPTLAAGTALILIHWLIAVVAFRTGWLGSVVKGRRVLLIENGKIQEEGMRQGHITSEDLAQALRMQTRRTDPSKIRLAYLERNGAISVVPYDHEPRILDVSVEKGVRTLRIEFH